MRRFRSDNYTVSQAFQYLRERTARDLAGAGLNNIPYFLIDNGSWSDAIHNHKLSFEPVCFKFDEYELVRFISDVARTRYTPGKQLVSSLQAVIARQALRLQQRHALVVRKRREAEERRRQHDALDILIFALPFYYGKPILMSRHQRCNLEALQALPFF